MLPQDFIDRIEHMLGEKEAAEFFASYDKERNHALRLNKLKGQNANFTIINEKLTDKLNDKPTEKLNNEDIPWEPTARYYSGDYEDGFRPGKHPYHEAGAYYIQEASAMTPAAYLMSDCQNNEEVLCETDQYINTNVLQNNSSELILDLCSAPGGKTTQIASYMMGRGLLVSNEIMPNRAKILAENVERMGIENSLVISEDPANLAKRYQETFHRIMVDAPCSGEGMFRKDDEASSHWSLENVRMCGERQDYILDAAYEMLRPGGRMVYSTCTFAPDENEGAVSRFLYRHPDMSILPVKKFQGMSDGSVKWAEEFGELGDAPVADGIENTIRLWPHKINGEGHFLAVLKKAGADMQAADDYKAEKSFSLKKLPELDDFAKNVLGPEEYKHFSQRTFIKFKEQICMVPQDFEIPSLKGLKVMRVGLHLGEIKKNRFEPSHAWALALTRDQVKAGVDLTMENNEDEVYKYFNGETFNYDVENGWHVVFVDGFSAGWGKVTGTTVKNHYPKGLRKNLR